MNKFIKAVAFLQHLFDQDRLAEQAGRIIEAILAARSPRLSDIAEHMTGSVGANYKAIQRFLHRVDLKPLLLRLLPAEAPYVIGDPTEIARPQAYKTEYVGKLKDRKTRGFWLLLLATPYRGRALPCGFVTYSSRTISQLQRSRNQYHWEAFEPLKAVLGSRPLVLDREFSYLELLEYFQHAGLSFVIRVHLGSRQPTFLDAAGRKITLTVSMDQQVEYHQLRYLGQVPVNVVGVWRKGHARPLWVMSNLAPDQALAIYTDRMKIEETFRDLKSLLNLDKLMNKSQALMEQMVALVLLAFVVGFLFGEEVRRTAYPHTPTAATSAPPADPADDAANNISRKAELYSGLFLLLKHKLTLSAKQWRIAHARAVAVFAQCVLPAPVRT